MSRSPLFFLAMIPGQRWLRARHVTIALWQLAIAGAAIGYVTVIVLSTGPRSVPAFTAYGLFKNALLSTEAAGSLALHRRSADLSAARRTRRRRRSSKV